ncbi:hypothetical protein Tco_0260384 [Tanacetum coccineum]
MLIIRLLRKYQWIVRLLLQGKLVLVDDDGNPLEKVDYQDNSNSDDEVEPVENKTASFGIKGNFGGLGVHSIGAKNLSLLAKWKQRFLTITNALWRIVIKCLYGDKGGFGSLAYPTGTELGHRAANCKMPKRVNPRQANMVNDDVDMIAMVSDVCAMISEVNLVEQLTMDRSCIWAILQLLISRAKEMLF